RTRSRRGLGSGSVSGSLRMLLVCAVRARLYVWYGLRREAEVDRVPPLAPPACQPGAILGLRLGDQLAHVPAHRFGRQAEALRQRRIAFAGDDAVEDAALCG